MSTDELSRNSSQDNAASSTCSQTNSQVRSNRRASEYYAAGRDFYDDMYHSEDSEGEASIQDTLNFSEPLYEVRKQELQALHSAFEKLQQQVKNLKNGDNDGVEKGSSSAKLSSRSKKRFSSNNRQSQQNDRGNGAPSICIIRGLSGTGKSTLFRQFIMELYEKSNEGQSMQQTNGELSEEAKPQDRQNHLPPRVLVGKFEELSGESPLSALLEAFGSLATSSPSTRSSSWNIQAHNTSTDLRAIRQKFIRKLGGRQAVNDLVGMLPPLQPLLNSTTRPQTSREADEENSVEYGRWNDDKSQVTISTGQYEIPSKNSNENAWNQLKFRLQALMQCISSSDDRPTILFIDDLQWMDSGTIEVLEMMLLDRSEIQNFMFVGSYRSDYKVPDAFWNTMGKAVEGGSQVTTIDVKNLTLEGMVTFLQKTLRMDTDTIDDGDDNEGERERLQELAKVLHEKTEGNIFFARQVLEELYAKSWLSFSRLTFTWEWDLDRIDISDNVLEAVSRRIKTDCSVVLQKILITAAYMRSTVDADSLMLAVDLDKVLELEEEGSDKFKPVKQRVIEELDKAVTSGFLTNMTGSNIYSFAHDRIKQAAYDMVEEGPTRDKFRRSMGNRLYRISKDKRLGRDWMLYSAADHFNATPQADSLFLAKVNLEAGRKSMTAASFKLASKYLGYGIDHIKSIRDAWKYHYQMILELHWRKAEAELLLGNLQEGRRVAEVVFQNATTDSDKLHTRMELAKALGRQESHVESLELSRKTLQEMGYYPHTKFGKVFGLIRDLLYARRYLRTHTDEEILDSEVVSDPTMETVFEFFLVSAYQSWFSGNLLEFLLNTCRSIRVSSKIGMCEASAVSFSAFGMFNDGIGNSKEAHRCLDLCLGFLQKYGDRGHLCLQLVIKALFLDGWNPDPKPVYDNLLRSHKVGLESGDFENSFMAYGWLLEHKFSHGQSLAVLDVQFAELVEKEKTYGVQSFLATTQGFWDPIRYLRGTAAIVTLTPSDLPFDPATKLDFSAYDQNTVAKIFHFRAALQIGVYWNDVEFLEKLLANVVPQQDKTHNQSAIRLCFLALAYGTVYQQRNSRKRYLRKARQCIRELKSLCESKGRNSWHRYLLACAHLKITSNKRSKTLSTAALINQYDVAMKAAMESGHKQDAALAAHLLVEQMVRLECSVDQHTLNEYLMQSRRLYKGWGATNLVRHLDDRYKTYIDENVSDALSAPTSCASNITKESIGIESLTGRQIATINTTGAVRIASTAESGHESFSSL